MQKCKTITQVTRNSIIGISNNKNKEKNANDCSWRNTHHDPFQLLWADENKNDAEYADENDPFSTLFLRKRCIVIVQKMEYVILTHDRLQPLSLEYRRVEFLPKYVQKCDISRYAIVALGVPPAPQGSRALSASRRFSL